MDEKLVEELRVNRELRIAITQKSFVYFMAVYFPERFGYAIADMHRQMYEVAEDTETFISVIVAFRGSAKSTIFSLVYPIWAMLGVQQKKFIVLAGNTQQQSRLHFANIKRALETNELLAADYGPFIDEKLEWSNSNIIVAATGTRIMSASTEQSIRGAIHGQYRPDLIIADDIEDPSSVKTLESRDKAEQWLTGDVVPLGDKGTKVVIVGNLLHEDSLLMRLKERINSGRMPGLFLEFPLVDNQGQIAWLAKYPNMEAIEEERRKIGNEVAWQREYMLRIISSEGQLVHQSWIHFYQELPDRSNHNFRFVAHGVDLANSMKTHADYTAIITAYVFGQGEDLKIYIAANPVNKRMEFPQAIQQIRNISNALGGNVYIENVAYQGAMIQQLQKENYSVFPVSPGGQDKWMRASSITPLIQSGTILFPQQGAETLIQQLLGFGIERHDDLVDALVYLVTEAVKRNRRLARAFPDKPPGW